MRLESIFSRNGKIAEFVQRVVWTFVQAAGATVIVAAASESIDYGEALIAAVIAGGLAALKLIVEFASTRTDA